jgi:hypothetical protein
MNVYISKTPIEIKNPCDDCCSNNSSLGCFFVGTNREACSIFTNYKKWQFILSQLKEIEPLTKVEIEHILEALKGFYSDEEHGWCACCESIEAKLKVTTEFLEQELK